VDLLTRADRVDVMKEFRKRLQYLARVIQVYSQKLREVLKKLPKEQLKTEESRIKVLALRTTSNIMTLVKDLLHLPPLFKAFITPSWKPSEVPQTVIGKRTMSVDNGPPAKKEKDGKHSGGQAIYQPPGGKYSEKAGNFPTDQSGQRGRGGRGFFRGRGQGRGQGRGRGWNRGRSRFY